MRIKILNRFRALTHDYGLPLWSTVGFVIIVVLMLLFRTYEKSILAGVLGDSSSNDSDYARLLSTDSEAELLKNEEGSDSGQNSTTSNTSLTINSGSSTTSTNGGGGTTDNGGEPPSGGGVDEEPPAVPFSAQIAGFGLRNQSAPIICSNSGPEGSLSQMCKQYDFVAGVNTYDGPGTVKHKLMWRGANTGGANNSYDAANGDAFTQVNYSIKLYCDQPGLYIFNFVITQPNTLKSHDIGVDHNCGTIMPPPGT